VKSLPKSNIVCRAPAFSLVEMAAVIAIIGTLMTAGVSLLSGTGAQSCKAAADLLTGLVEQAQTTAITSRSHVLLAIAEPGDLAAGDERCRIGLFKIGEWPDSPRSPLVLTGVQVKRWQTLETGIVLRGGDVDGVANPLDGEQVTIRYGGTGNPGVKVHMIAFNPRGGLHYPAGSAPVAFRIAEGRYRGGKAVTGPRDGSERRLKIGRVTARPYRTDE
jgi:prepilin-type N-terminal cleavage/methylation domain-containing protein